MRDLIRLLGCTVNSEDSRLVLDKFVGLEPEEQDLAPDEGVEKDFYLYSPSEGISIKHTSTGEITTICLMSQGKDGYSQYSHSLLGSLSFSSSPEQVRRELGVPAFEKEANLKPGLFFHGAIMRYDQISHSIHFQFRTDGKGIELITLMSPSSVPGRRSNG